MYLKLSVATSVQLIWVLPERREKTVKVVECGRECKTNIKEVHRKRKAFQKRKRQKRLETISGGFRVSLEQN